MATRKTAKVNGKDIRTNPDFADGTAVPLCGFCVGHPGSDTVYTERVHSLSAGGFSRGLQPGASGLQGFLLLLESRAEQNYLRHTPTFSSSRKLFSSAKRFDSERNTWRSFKSASVSQCQPRHL